MLEKDGVQVIGTRSEEHWLNVDAEFRRAPFLKNYQRPWITRGNMDSGVRPNLESSSSGAVEARTSAI
jgi:hypothetical protein